MQTGKYITVDEIIFKAAGYAGDIEHKIIPKGFYVHLIADAFEELNGDTKMMIGHFDSAVPDSLSIPLPDDCFNVRGVWVYSGNECDFGSAQKLWHKRNYYTRGGTGYIANRTGNHIPDPFYTPFAVPVTPGQSVVDGNRQGSINNNLFYNIQNGVLMVSSSAKAAGTKIHIEYNSTGCDVSSAPVIPYFYRPAIEDFVTEAALRFRTANDLPNAKIWQALGAEATRRLDKNGFYGSWHKAVKFGQKMSKAEREDLAVYLERGAWATGR